MMISLAGRTLKPELWPTLVSLPALLLVVFLGVWQIERLEWKEALIEQINAELQKEPQPLPMALPELGPREYRFFTATGYYLHDKTLYRAAQYQKNILGYHLLTPMQLEDGRILLVNRGWVPKEQKDPAARPGSEPSEPLTIKIMVHRGNLRGWFVPDNSPEKNQWFWYDLPTMRQTTGVELLPIVADAVQVHTEGGLPIASKGEIEIRNDHLSYAITWFAIAITIIAIYTIYHWQRAVEQDASK